MLVPVTPASAHEIKTAWLYIAMLKADAKTNMQAKRTRIYFIT